MPLSAREQEAPTLRQRNGPCRETNQTYAISIAKRQRKARGQPCVLDLRKMQPARTIEERSPRNSGESSGFNRCPGEDRRTGTYERLARLRTLRHVVAGEDRRGIEYGHVRQTHISCVYNLGGHSRSIGVKSHWWNINQPIEIAMHIV